MSIVVSVVTVETVVFVLFVLTVATVAGVMTVADAEIAAIAASVVIVASVEIEMIVQIAASVVVHLRHPATQSPCHLKTNSMPSCVVTLETWVQVVKRVATANTKGRIAILGTFERASTGNRDWLFCS